MRFCNLFAFPTLFRYSFLPSFLMRSLCGRYPFSSGPSVSRHSALAPVEAPACKAPVVDAGSIVGVEVGLYRYEGGLCRPVVPLFSLAWAGVNDAGSSSFNLKSGGDVMRVVMQVKQWSLYAPVAWPDLLVGSSPYSSSVVCVVIRPLILRRVIGPLRIPVHYARPVQVPDPIKNSRPVLVVV